MKTLSNHLCYKKNSKKLILLAVTFFSYLFLSTFNNASAGCKTTQPLKEIWTIGSIAAGQSFMPACSGTLTSILVHPDSTVASTLKIYRGESDAPGDLLHTQIANLTANQNNTIVLSAPIALTSHQQYTFIFSGTRLMYNGWNPYADGNLYDLVGGGNSAARSDARADGDGGMGFHEGADLFFTADISSGASSVPTLSEWGVIVFLLLISITAIWKILREQDLEI